MLHKKYFLSVSHSESLEIQNSNLKQNCNYFKTNIHTGSDTVAKVHLRKIDISGLPFHIFVNDYKLNNGTPWAMDIKIFQK